MESKRLLTIDGVSRSCREWAQISGVKLGTLASRLHRGWPDKDAVFGRARKKPPGYWISGTVCDPHNPWAKHGHCSRHGQVTPTYKSYRTMIDRCFYPKSSSYHLYGGRGITVCDRWRYGENGLSGFDCFLADMGERPAGTSLDRYPNNKGHYEPGNCRWATVKQQGRNKTNNRMLRCYSGPRGEKPVCEWADISGTDAGKIHARLRAGWAPKEAVFGRPAKRPPMHVPYFATLPIAA